MILLLLTNHEVVEVSSGRDVIHKLDSLVCIDADELEIASFPTTKVLGYTLNEAVAERMKEEGNHHPDGFHRRPA